MEKKTERARGCTQQVRSEGRRRGKNRRLIIDGGEGRGDGVLAWSFGDGLESPLAHIRALGAVLPYSISSLRTGARGVTTDE